MNRLYTRPVLLQVIYYMPNHPSLLQEFTWGFDDQVPELIKTHTFLNYWRQNINAVIADVLISIANENTSQWRNAEKIFKLN